MQAIAAGAISSLAEARKCIRESVATEQFLPQDTDVWQAAYERFKAVNKR
jgi:rhamnulokinase/L-fuculokinase